MRRTLHATIGDRTFLLPQLGSGTVCHSTRLNRP